MAQKFYTSNNASFGILRGGGYLYVDKTRFLYDLVIQEGNMFFCARPRRFGKTLTVSTLEAIFQGKRELFKGLYIDSSDYDWKTYPVIHVNFADCSEKSGQELDDWIRDLLVAIGRKYQIVLDPHKPCRIAFKNLLDAFQNRGEKVVILIDEYDKVVSDNLYNPELSDLQDVLSSFYSVIKAYDSIIRFAFLTGVTKYAKLSVFSGMNNLRDISLDDSYASMFGYTQEELEQNFAPYIEKGLKNSGMDRNVYLSKLKRMYDGYRFSSGGESVYNPVSVGSFFSAGGTNFAPYWAETGNTKLLLDVARKVDFNLATDLEEPVSTSSSFDITRLTQSDVSSDDLKWLLYQSGYLTIGRIQVIDDNLFYYLTFPNKEVAQAFCSSLLSAYTKGKMTGTYLPSLMMEALEKDDLAFFMDKLKSVYASLSYPTKPTEFVFSMALGVFLFFCNPSAITNEEHTSIGRIDMVFRLEKAIYIFEYKVDQEPEVALKQIKDKHYADRFKAEGKAIHLVGISFSSKTRNISGWKEESI